MNRLWGWLTNCLENPPTFRAKKPSSLFRFIEKIHKDDKTDPYMDLIEAFNTGHAADVLPGVNPYKIMALENLIKKSNALACLGDALQGKQLQPQ